MATTRNRSTFLVLVALTLGGCSTQTSGIPPSASGTSNATPAHAAVPASLGPRLFVSTGRQNLIQIYDAAGTHHKLLGEITRGLVGPNGEAVDALGNLYVANADGASVTVYARGGTTPIRKYKKGLSNPLTPAIGSDGTLYVSNFNPDASGAILEYAPGHMTPTFKIPLAAGAIGLALDAADNVYVTTYGSTGRILEFPPKSKRGRDLGISLVFAGRMIVDRKGNLIVCDQGVPAVDVFPPGATQPSKQITGGFTDPFGLALNRRSTRLYVADGAGPNVYVYSYPELQLKDKIKRGVTSFGIAIDPPAP